MDDLLSTDDLFEAAGRYGYLHPGYAEAYVEAGEVRHLRRSGAWLLTRPIPGSHRRDALVGHPLLVCRDWRALPDDLTETAALADVVTVSALTDPLAPAGEVLLREAFPDFVRIHAQHFVVDLAAFWPAREHRRAVRAASHLVEIDIEESPTARLDDWERIGGIAGPAGLRLTRSALRRQLAVPGCVGITALDEDGPVAMAIIYISGDDAHLHAVASSERGEELGAPYAIIAAAAEDMVGRGLRLLDLGTTGAADSTAAAELTRFMSGWTEVMRPSYLCGRLVDGIAYDALAAEAGTTGSASFPAYRDPAARLGDDGGDANRAHSGGSA